MVAAEHREGAGRRRRQLGQEEAEELAEAAEREAKQE